MFTNFEQLLFTKPLPGYATYRIFKPEKVDVRDSGAFLLWYNPKLRIPVLLAAVVSIKATKAFPNGNFRNPKSAKLLQLRTYSSLRSSKVINLGVNWKIKCNFLLVINGLPGNHGMEWTISYRFRDIDAFCSKIACFPTPALFYAP